MNLAKATLLLTLASMAAWAQANGDAKPEATMPFNMTTTDNFELPWRIAVLPDGRMLITEKIGPIWLVSAEGKKISPVNGTPAVWWNGQSGMFGVYLSPTYATDQNVYITYSEPGDNGGGLALAQAKLVLPGAAPAAPAGPGGGGGARLQGFKVLWHQMPKGKGGQEGAAVAFAPDGKSLFLTVGDRMRFTPAQDPDQPVGKILHLTLDGKPAPDNPNAGKTGGRTIPLIDPTGLDTETAKTAKVVSTYTFPAENLTPAETWTSGHRTPYGLSFAPNGELWEVEHAPKSGDELNLIEKGKNYGWPVVAYGPNYNGKEIPHPDTRPDLAKAAVYWNPNIAPGNLMFYKGKQAFPQWDGNGFITGLATQSINRFIVDGKGGAKMAERWRVGKRVRDLAEAPDGTLWMIEDANPGALVHVTPK